MFGKNHPTSVQVCRYCRHANLVWYKARSGKWWLATPFPGTLRPNPRSVHLCQFKNQKGRSIGN